ncbi:MAG: DUF6323 family protein [Mollicutes bacterium]|nr:DUF6323 family protein [Mollicutes bacterium]
MNNLTLYVNDQENFNNLIKLNELTKSKNLIFTDEEILNLIKNKNDNLKDIGRVEIGKSVIDDIVYSFYDSEYIDNDNYFETINELINIFYMYQDKFSEYLTDSEIIGYLRDNFDKVNGSLELLSSISFDKLNTKLMYGEYYE